MAVKDGDFAMNTLSETTLLEAILPHVPFEGWSEAAFVAAVSDLGADLGAARLICPRGGLDLAALAHRLGDEALVDVSLPDGLRYSEKVGEYVWLRLLAAGDREAVRAASAVFALPQNAVEGARLIWGTADAIWNVLGDTSEDANWYSKRAILSGVYGASVLYWLGDESAGAADTRAFIERRIGDVMQFERLKGKVRESKLLGPLERLMSGIKKPAPPVDGDKSDAPGRWTL